MKSFVSVDGDGLLAAPPMPDTQPSSDKNIKRLIAEEVPSWFQCGTTERIATKHELADIRRELRGVIFVRTTALIPWRLGIVEGLKRQTDAMPLWYLWLLVLFAPLAIVGSAQWLVAGVPIAKQLLGWAGIALYGTIMAQAIHGLVNRRQTHNKFNVRAST
jgi:hypothetical protein